MIRRLMASKARLKSSTTVAICPISSEGSRMVMEIRNHYRKHFVLPKDCPRCSKWPAAERKLRMSTVDEFPEDLFSKGRLCARCMMEFFAGFHRYWELHP